MLNNCNCSPIPTVPCSSQSPIPQDCDKIRMFFGYSTSDSNLFPGQLEKLYYTDPINQNYIDKGFIISQYKATQLFKSQIIPEDITFNLTEVELLATATFPGWCVFAADYIVGMTGGIDKFGIINDQSVPFGLKCMAVLDININDFRVNALKMWNALVGGDIGSLYSALFNTALAPAPQVNRNITGQSWCDEVKLGIKLQKLEVCYAWLKNIYDTYYGKQFLVDVSNNNDYTQGICVKDENGNSITSNLPMYIDGDGSSQGYYTSDEIADGGFPKENSNNLLGLSEVDWVQNTDGKIQSFVRIGYVSDENNIACGGILAKRYVYKKFKDENGRCVEWTIDLSKLNPDNYLIRMDTASGTKNILYLKCSIENRFYLENNRTWINIILPEKVPLVNSDLNPMLALRMYHYLVSVLRPTKSKTILNNITNVIGIAGGGAGLLGAAFTGAFTSGSQYIFGAKSSVSQANIVKANDICLIPEGVVIPFKSNVYRYGPYFHVTNPDEGGGVEILVEENIAPWNFIKPGSISFPDKYPYCAMDKFGKELSKFVTKGLQKIEKGRATVVGFPCYNIGDSVDAAGNYSGFEVGPTLLTDISIDYGSGGFNTTYNFATYTPRLGKSEKYIRDAWQKNIEKNKDINSYLRSEREKVNNIKKDYTKKLLEENLYFTPLAPHKDSTPNKLIFSGYYISDKSDDMNILSPETYTFPNVSIPPESSCYPSSSPLPFESMEIPPSPTANTESRRYTFSETDKGYSIQQIQNTYYQLTGMGLDGFYLPVSLRGVNADPKVKEIDNNALNLDWQNQARLPRFSMYAKYSGSSISFMEWDNDNNLDIKSDAGYPISSKTRDEIPPFKLTNSSSTDCYLLPINQKYLNPYLSKALLSDWTDRKNSSDTGFVISSIVFGQEYTNFQITHTDKDSIYNEIGNPLNTLEDSDIDEEIRQQYKNFRIPALRGPLVLQGWGYDTSGKPIPNSADNYINAEYGQFRKDQLTDKFLKNWLQNPKSWPVGPIDLRFDRERGVWTCPSPNKIITVRLKEDLPSKGKAKAQLVNPTAGGISFYEKYHISGPDGENIKLYMDNTEVTVYDFIGTPLKKCTVAYAYYDDNRYIVLRSDQDSKQTPPSNIIRFRNINICNIVEQVEHPEDYYGADTWGAYAGYGDKYYNYHTYGIRIDCDGNPIDSEGKPPENPPLTISTIEEDPSKWLIELLDNAGKFGPSFGRFENEEQWKNEASTGYALYMSPSSGNGTNIDPASSDGVGNFPGIINNHTIIIPGDYNIKFNYQISSDSENGIINPLRFQILCNDELLADTGFIGDDQFQNISPYNEKWGGTDTTGCLAFDIKSDCSELQIKIIGSSNYSYSLKSSSAKCSLGSVPPCKMNSSCSDFSTYEILFIESYARFLEGFLTEDLYLPPGSPPPLTDQYKIDNPSGNAAITGIICYGDSPNGQTPIYLDSDYTKLSVRVFDPFMDMSKDKNPFRKLKSGDKILSIFDEKTKKYKIWQSVKDQDRVIKFALIADKQNTDVLSTGVFVDQYGRPTDSLGTLLDQNNFNEHFITINDPFLNRSSLAPPVPIAGTILASISPFGPALGSNIFDEHYTGIPLNDITGVINMPPFIGFALQREIEGSITYEIIQLQRYAQYIKGKICTKKSENVPNTLNNGSYYLATMMPLSPPKPSDGEVVPVARYTGDLARGDLVISHELDQFTGVHSKIIGDLHDNADGISTYDNVDGCEFIAILNGPLSNTDNLVYTIIQSEYLALKGDITLKDIDIANKLNNNDDLKLDSNTSNMETNFYQGFMWDKINSKINFEKVAINNRDDWTDKGLFITDSKITTTLLDFDNDNNPIYIVEDGGTIARVAQRVIDGANPGTFGHPDYNTNLRKVKIGDDTWEGLDPSIINDINKPKIQLCNNQQWMTYSSGIITSLWDETQSNTGKISECSYKIIYAQEAPIIITGSAVSSFPPTQIDNINISTTGINSSCQGVGNDPMPTLLTKVENPLGYGALANDKVTIQRVFTGTIAHGANYKYIIIGTGAVPTSCG